MACEGQSWCDGDACARCSSARRGSRDVRDRTASGRAAALDPKPPRRGGPHPVRHTLRENPFRPARPLSHHAPRSIPGPGFFPRAPSECGWRWDGDDPLTVFFIVSITFS